MILNVLRWILDAAGALFLLMVLSFFYGEWRHNRWMERNSNWYKRQ